MIFLKTTEFSPRLSSPVILYIRLYIFIGWANGIVDISNFGLWIFYVPVRPVLSTEFGMSKET